MGSVANIDKLRFKEGDVNTSTIRLAMQKTMQNHAAVFRDGPVMREGIQKMNGLWKDMDNVKLTLVRTSRTGWTSWTMPSPLRDRPPFPWRSTGESTHSHSPMELLARLS